MLSQKPLVPWLSVSCWSLPPNNSLIYSATEIVRQAEMVGGTNVDSRINDLKSKPVLTRPPSAGIVMTAYSGKKVQLNTKIFGMTLTETVETLGFRFRLVPLLRSQPSNGKSPVYYK